MGKVIRFFKVLSLTILLAGPIFAPSKSVANPEEVNGDYLAAALEAVRQGDWVAANYQASQISDPVGRDIVFWARLRAGEGSWPEYQDFLEQHGDWPGLKRLRKEAEAVIPKRGDAAIVKAFFAAQPPQTGTGALRYAEAYEAQGRVSEARGVIIDAWRTMPLTRDETTQFLERYSGIVSRHHLERLNTMLWNRHTVAASRMLELVTPGQARLAEARIGLQRASKGIDALIEAVPPGLRGDAGLAYDRFRWRVEHDRWDDAEALLIERSATGSSLGRPEAWAERRRTFARRAMRAGDYEKAYILASRHRLSSGSNFADLEWLSGYIALRYLADPEQAAKHFGAFSRAVKTPISLGRAGYWLGRAHEELGDLSTAADHYTKGALHQTSFYGQLAAERLNLPPDETLTGHLPDADWRDGTFADDPVTRAAVLFHYAQEPYRVRWFMTHMAETMDKTSAAQLADLALELNQPFVALGIAKEVAKRGIVLTKPYFPLTDLAFYSADIEAEVALSIARRESEFNETAVSPAGARGLMQVMPATARQVADELGIEYSKARLTSDWRYNATLGTAYMAGLLDIYEGSYVLSFAAYNAGPHRADRWIEQYGDPRDPDVDPVDWIEMIPFRETRNYVMRVIESLHVYRARIQGAAQNVSLTADLKRG